MKKILIIICAMLFSWNAHAVEVGGVNLADMAQVGDAALQLNGSGIRTKVVFDIYVAALYLETKTRKSDVILADTGSKRVALHILFSLKSSTLLDALKNGIESNNSSEELAAIAMPLKKFYSMFDALPSVKKGDVILLDYLPGKGTRVMVNGNGYGVVEGAEFNRALLKIWLGPRPVQDDLKMGLLGF